MGLTKEERIQKEIDIENALKEYFNTPELDRSLTKLGKKYEVKRQTLSKRLKLNGEEVINYQNRIRFDENVFDHIDTEEKAYWLGFIFADGCILQNEKRFQMNLSIRDIEHMKKFMRFLKSELKPLKNGPYCRMSIRNKNLWNQLNNKGCVPNKSLKLKFPDEKIFKSSDLIRHFIRGYVDGDGYLGIYKLKNKTNQYREQMSIVGTKEFLMKCLEIFGYPEQRIHNKLCKNWQNKSFDIKFAALKARKIARFLYENSTIYLDRKYNIYKQFCLLEEKSSLKKSSKIGESCDANPELNSEITKRF